MKLIGLTGGIGSGKSTAADIFRTLGIPVFDSDMRAKQLMNHDPELKSAITELFGPEAYSEEGELNRSWIGSKVFSSPLLLRKLNALVHPKVEIDLRGWSSSFSTDQYAYLIQESAILFEENLTPRLDGVILVVAPEEVRIKRVMERDGVTRDQVMARISQQWLDEKKIPLADYVIFNDGTRSLLDQVLDIDNMIRDDNTR